MIKKEDLLKNIPDGLRTPLFDEFNGLIKSYSEGRWKLSSLDGGRFCEVVYTILDGVLSSKFKEVPSKPDRFPEACKALESKAVQTIGDRSLRILIPRILPGMYEIRNNRNVGHVGGDVSSNKMDAAFLRNCAVWIMSELIRVFHNTTISEAQAVVDSLSDNYCPLIWELDGQRRVLNSDLSMPEKTLLLLHSVTGWCEIARLEQWVKAGRGYRSNVINRLFEKSLIEYNQKLGKVIITPLGVKKAEEIIAKK